MHRLVFKGEPRNIDQNLIGTATIERDEFNHTIITLKENIQSKNPADQHLIAIITSNPSINFQNVPSILLIEDINQISNGDILSLDSFGNIRILYQASASSNSLFVTEQCNSRCVMCAQPPRVTNDIEHFWNINQNLIELIPTNCRQLGITGGEPTLLGYDLIRLLKLLTQKLPETELHILSNAKLFSNIDYAAALLELDSRNIVWGVPLYSDYFELHDRIVHSKNAFYQTILGIHNLARFNQRIEIRTVLHSQVIPRLTNLARYIYKNLTFIEHVAFMGLENVGLAKNNIESLWMNPLRYSAKLLEATIYLDKNALNVSIYNLPLCLLPKDLWKFSRQSISEWKNSFLQKCEICKVKNECAGLFESNIKNLEEIIQPIITEEISVA